MMWEDRLKVDPLPGLAHEAGGEQHGVLINDVLRGFHLGQVPLKRSPPHPLRLFDVVADAVIRSEPRTGFEGPAQGSFAGALTLGGVPELVGLA
jgi:hypothetical protein